MHVRSVSAFGVWCVVMWAAAGGRAAEVDTNAPSPEVVTTVTNNLAPMVVLAREIAPSWLYGQLDSSSRALAAIPGVRIDSQGGYGAQNDLSIRGSSFSGAGLSLAGLSLRNPQSEHFNTELPLPASLFTGPRVLTGLAQALHTDGHLVGSVAQDFAPVRATRRLSGGVGEVDRQWQSALVQQPLQATASGGQWGAGAFGSHESADAIDYTDNDLDLWNAGGQMQFAAPDAQFDLAAGIQNKEFGARGYYGVNDALPAKEEVEDVLVLASGRRGALDETFVRTTVEWRETDDEYRILPAVFHNQTDTRVFAAFADGRAAADSIPALALNWRAGFEDETLDGITLGNQDRQRGVAQLLPAWTAGPVTLTAGARGEVFTDDEPAVLPQAGIDWQATDATTFYASYTETVRQPSYTELNYDSPGSLGNAGLERQESRAVEAGLRQQLCNRLSAHAAVFQQWSEESVDWVKSTTNSTRFEAVNLDQVDTFGAEFGLQGDFTDRIGLAGQYTWIDKESDEDVYASRYVLDYARHLLQLSATWQVIEALRLTGTQTLRWQEENPLRESDDFGATGGVAAHVTVPSLPHATLTVALDNVWDDDFQPFAGQEVAGRRVSGGLTVDW